MMDSTSFLRRTSGVLAIATDHRVIVQAIAAGPRHDLR